MKLIIDIGNTRVKAGLFEQKELVHSFVFETTDALLDANLFLSYNISRCIIASVVNDIESFISRLKEHAQVVIFTGETPVPVKNLYRSANTLGSDRLACAAGANFLFPGKNILVIDAGTCIKYNFINSSSEFIGGAISPGLRMRFKALHTFTSRLPLLELDEKFDALIGRDTNENILSGVEFGAIAEMQGFIEHYKLLYPDICIFLTGGDADFFEKRLKKPIFADSFLILKGLNVILDYQYQ